MPTESLGSEFKLKSKLKYKILENPGEGSEIEPETVYVQAVGASSGVTAYLLYNGSASYCC